MLRDELEHVALVCELHDSAKGWLFNEDVVDGDDLPVVQLQSTDENAAEIERKGRVSQ